MSVDRFDQRRIVVPDVADALADRPRGHVLRRVGRQQGREPVGVALILPEPEWPRLGRHDPRNNGMIADRRVLPLFETARYWSEQKVFNIDSTTWQLGTNAVLRRDGLAGDDRRRRAAYDRRRYGPARFRPGQ
jgi:hypothetical protein